MDKNKSDKVLAFDTLYTSNHIQMLKIFLPYLDINMQKYLAIYIKYAELQYTLSFYRRKEREINICERNVPLTDMTGLLEELTPYCSEAEKKRLDKIINLKNTLEMITEMQSAMDMFGAFSGDNPMNAGGQSAMDMLDMLKSMLTPEQQAMFEMFNQTSFNNM